MSAPAGVRSLPQTEWPEADRAAWQDACRPGARLIRGGAASHLKLVTQADLERRYCYFLDHLRRSGSPFCAGSPACNVTPENVASYIAQLQPRVGSVTVHGSVYKLRRMAELIAPEAEFGWLREIEADLELLKRPRSKYPRLFTTTALLEAGLTLIAEADLPAEQPFYSSVTRESRAARRRLRGMADRAQLRRAVLARNGLILAVLALCPIRIKNFAALSLGSTFVDIEGTWWIIIEPEDAKTGRADERPLPAWLTPHVSRYVKHHRPVLARGKLDQRSGALWISSQNGSPMPRKGVEKAIRQATAVTLGIEVGPHMFRTAGATSATVLAPSIPGLASALLQHVDPRITEQHYNRATTREAAQAYNEVFREIRR